jgi:hypothetical protein
LKFAPQFEESLKILFEAKNAIWNFKILFEENWSLFSPILH